MAEDVGERDLGRPVRLVADLHHERGDDRVVGERRERVEAVVGDDVEAGSGRAGRPVGVRASR
jgi:hypothetical protein